MLPFVLLYMFISLFLCIFSSFHVLPFFALSFLFYTSQFSSLLLPPPPSVCLTLQFSPQRPLQLCPPFLLTLVLLLFFFFFISSSFLLRLFVLLLDAGTHQMHANHPSTSLFHPHTHIASSFTFVPLRLRIMRVSLAQRDASLPNTFAIKGKGWKQN